jgi:hypothetical protein
VPRHPRTCIAGNIELIIKVIALRVNITQSMPSSTVAELDPLQIATSWLSLLNDAFVSKDVNAISALFQPNGWLRDLLVFTWDWRSLHGRDKIANYLTSHIFDSEARDFKLDTEHGIHPSIQEMGPTIAVEAAFTFNNTTGNCRGLATLVQDEDSQWRAFIAFIMLDDIRGHEERKDVSYIYEERTTTWKEIKDEQVVATERDPDVVICE